LKQAAVGALLLAAAAGAAHIVVLTTFAELRAIEDRESEDTLAASWLLEELDRTCTRATALGTHASAAEAVGQLEEERLRAEGNAHANAAEVGLEAKVLAQSRFDVHFDDILGSEGVADDPVNASLEGDVVRPELSGRLLCATAAVHNYSRRGGGARAYAGPTAHAGLEWDISHAWGLGGYVHLHHL